MMQAQIRHMCRLTVVVVASVVVFAGTAFAQSSNPFIGTWKLNPAQSKYNAGTAPKSSTIKYEAAGAGVKVTLDAVNADGTVSQPVYTTNYDGKESPITGTGPNINDVTVATRVDANTTRRINKKGGKVTTTATYVVSSDGKTMTVTTTGTNPQGQKVDNVTVYEKQ